MTFEADDRSGEAKKLNNGELILLELRVISTILAEIENLDADQIREAINADY